MRQRRTARVSVACSLAQRVATDQGVAEIPNQRCNARRRWCASSIVLPANQPSPESTDPDHKARDMAKARLSSSRKERLRERRRERHRDRDVDNQRMEVPGSRLYRGVRVSAVRCSMTCHNAESGHEGKHPGKDLKSHASHAISPRRP